MQLKRNARPARMGDSKTELSKKTMRIVLISLVLAVLGVGLSGEEVTAQSQSRIYGVIHTIDGEDYRGFIRWDLNEVGWDNILDGTKERPHTRETRRRRHSRRKSWFRSLFSGSFVLGRAGRSGQSGTPFGFLERLEPEGDDAVILTFKGGEELEFKHGSTDIGSDIREILIEDKSAGEVELEWDEIEWIVFSQAPVGAESRGSNSRSGGEVRRIYGTVTTRRRDRFTGYIGWDYDESLSSDILDGYVSGRKRKVKFGKIASIERRGSDRSLVITRDGKKLRMEDSNDVDDRNNGIVVSDSSLGRIVVEWDEFDRLELSEPPPGRSYNSYGAVRPLRGVVTTEAEEKLAGKIVWDADEVYTWELLDGDYRDVTLAIVFANIATIEKVRRGARVTLRDGREFRLRHSNDIDRGNRGIFVTPDNGESTEISWKEFLRVDFTGD